MEALERGGHRLKAVIVLNISEDEVWRRWEQVKDERNGGRADDISKERVQRRLDEYAEKTVPVIQKYHQLGLALDVDAGGTIKHTFDSAIDQLYRLASR